MAATPRKTAPGWAATLWNSERWLLACVVFGVVLGLCVVGVIASGGRWLPSDEDSAARPQWVTTEAVRATTRDGKVVKAKVAVDAPDADTRAWLSSRPRQVAMLMQISVSEHEAGDVGGAQRVQRLAEDMEARLNHMLTASRMAPVRGLVIQDLVISTP